MQESGNKGGYIQGYNAQIAVDAKSQVIVMAAVTQENPDNQHLLPMVEELERELGQLPRKLLADARILQRGSDPRSGGEGGRGVLPSRTVEGGRDRSLPERSAPARRAIHRAHAAEASGACEVERSIGGGRSAWSRRSGRSRQGRGFRQFLVRGREKVGGEWKLVCLTHNLRKLHTAGWA